LGAPFLGAPERIEAKKFLALILSLKFNNRSMKKIFFIATILLLAGFIFPKTVLGIGMMTEPIVIKNALRGQETTAVLDLFNSEDKKIVYELKSEGEIAKWASFYRADDTDFKNPITEIQIPAKSSLKAVVKFTIPKDTPNGEYSGKVAIVTAPLKEDKKEKMKVALRQKVGRKVLITVTDEEILEFKTSVIPLKYKMEEGEPLKIKVIYDNQGNVSIKPDIQLQISKNGRKIFNAIFPYPEDEKPVKPLERKILSSLIEWQTVGQESGEYAAEVKTLLNGEEKQTEDFRFTVGDVVAGAEKSNMDKFFGVLSAFGRGNPTVGWFIIGGIFLIIAEILITINRRKKRS